MSAFAITLVFAAGAILAAYSIYTYKSSSSRPDISLSTYSYLSTVDVKPYQFPPLKLQTSTKLGMGLKRLDQSNWLTIDPEYLPEHKLRLELLSSKRSNVIECLPPSITACHEVLELAVSFLVSRFPQQFTTSKTPLGPVIHNHITGEIFPIGSHSQCVNPLETAALLAMEDLNVLIKDSLSGDYLLQASATLFPAGWKLQERIGTSLESLHAPVPGWNAKLGAHVNRYFDHLSSRTAMERSNVFIQTTPTLFQDEPEGDAGSNYVDVKMEEITVRRERQTFTRLPKSNAVLFTVRTFMTPLVDMNDEQLQALRSQIWGWEEDIRMYKGWCAWGDKVEEWCEKRLGARDPQDVTKSKGGCPMQM